MSVQNLLERIYHSENDYRAIDQEINDIVGMIRLGYGIEKINKKRNTDFRELFEFAKSRIRISRKYSCYKHLFLDYYSSMYSTPEIVGKYRADRLKNHHIIDAGSGAGMQDIMFSLYSDVTGIEMNKSRYLMALLNRIPYRSDANFICKDFFDYSGDFNGKIIFSDPLRPQNTREKFFSQLSPNPLDSISVSHDIEGYAIDLPPHMKWENIPIKGEKEYISIDGNLNRLTIYSPSISNSESSAVILPQKIVLSGKPEEFKNHRISRTRDKEYLFVPDISIIYAKLLNQVIDPEWELVYSDNRRNVFTGNYTVTPFPGKRYTILDYSTNLDIESILKKLDAKKVFFRFSMEPKETYRLKNNLEKNLTGSKSIYIFKGLNKYIIAE